jgi:hypothetical protein
MRLSPLLPLCFQAQYQAKLSECVDVENLADINTVAIHAGNAKLCSPELSMLLRPPAIKSMLTSLLVIEDRARH